MTSSGERSRSPMIDEQQKQAEFARDVISGLNSNPKRLSPKYFYDETGCRLFEEITRQPEYYLTRCELEILETHAPAMAKLAPPGAALVEFGTGSTRKVRKLLGAARAISAYIPVDIAADALAAESAALARDFPGLDVIPLVADFTRDFELPAAVARRPRIGFFPGSTIGNFEPDEARAFLARAGAALGAKAALIVGVDLVKAHDTLEAAYNDRQGVTAAFNLNLLARINRELDADFRLDRFAHHAFYDADRGRIEMHLRSLRRQAVRLDGLTIAFSEGESIHTENSYKYSAASFSALAARAGWTTRSSWTDAAGYFAVFALANRAD